MSPPWERHAAGPLPLLRLIWRSYLTSALIPVFVIELALIAAYLITNSIIRDQNIASLQRLATEQLRHTAQQQAEQISLQLAAVAYNADLLRHHTESALQTPFVPDDAERSRYAFTPDGTLYTTHGLPGRPALFYSKLSRPGEAEYTKALQLSQLDRLLASLVETNPLVVQSYVHTTDRMVRIYPYFDVTKRFATDYDVTSYNFFYEADAAHNAERKVIWTDVYVDPAGLGWMASAVAPVYPGRGDRLEAVVGLDVTVGLFTQQVLRLRLPWSGYGVLVDKRDAILALSSQGERDWGLKELTDYSHQEAIRQDTFKPDSFRLTRREDSRALGQRMLSEREGLDTLTLAGRRKQVAWSTVESTGWKLLVIMDEAEIFAEAQALSARFLRVGLGMIAAMVLFYALFFAWLYRRVRRMSALLAVPLMDLEAMMHRIGQGEYTQPQPAYPVLELQRTGEGLVRMGQRLLQSNASLQQAQQDLEQLNVKLEERIHLRTRELEEANSALHQENAAKQSLIQELQRTQSQLVQSEKQASLAQLAAGIAHELKNPLNFINNLSEINVELAGELASALREQPQALGEAQKITRDLEQNAEVIYRHALRADRIIWSMMEHTRSRSGEFEPTDIVTLVEDYLRLTYHGERARDPEVQVTFVRELDPQVGAVLVVPQELGRVLQNLIHNAIYAVCQKRRESTGAYVPTITVRTLREGGDVIIQVEDNGPGIPKDIQARIFEPFFTTKPPDAGNTGLGLSLSYDIVVKLHGGSLTVESEMNRYTRFTVRLLPAGQARAR